MTFFQQPVPAVNEAQPSQPCRSMYPTTHAERPHARRIIISRRGRKPYHHRPTVAPRPWVVPATMIPTAHHRPPQYIVVRNHHHSAMNRRFARPAIRRAGIEIPRPGIGKLKSEESKQTEVEEDKEETPEKGAFKMKVENEALAKPNEEA